MIPARFTETTRQHGLYRKGVGLGAVQDLAALAQTPVPVIPPTSWHERSKKPTTITHMGALIRAGLAARDGDHYRATQEGVAWLAKIIELQILPIPETTSLKS
jgi:hypothetical protein